MTSNYAIFAGPGIDEEGQPADWLRRAQSYIRPQGTPTASGYELTWLDVIEDFRCWADYRHWEVVEEFRPFRARQQIALEISIGVTAVTVTGVGRAHDWP